jgi:tRNA threonylcarbamoyladenosine biosynthesis protein TsaE
VHALTTRAPPHGFSPAPGAEIGHRLVDDIHPRTPVAPLLAGGMVVTLRGDLGSGKTTLVRGVLRARGVEGPIKSPTYTLVEHYPVSSLYFYHFDFYRLANSDEWDDTGFAEYFRRDSVGLVEWPERVAGLLASPDLA